MATRSRKPLRKRAKARPASKAKNTKGSAATGATSSPRQSYNHLKARVRRDYERTETSIRELAARYGITSENTIRKWRDSEGWQKNVEQITARLVTRAIAMDGDPSTPIASILTIEGEATQTSDQPPLAIEGPAPEPEERPDPERNHWPWGFGVFTKPSTFAAAVAAANQPITQADGTGIRGKNPQMNRRERRAEALVPQVHTVTDCAPSAHSEIRDTDTTFPDETAHAFPPEEGRAPPSARAHKTVTKTTSIVAEATAVRDEEERVDLSMARNLAEIHAAAIKRQIAYGDRIMELGAMLITNCTIAVMPLPADASDADRQAQATIVGRLTSVNADKERLSDLAKTGAILLKQGVELQRRALGMDIVPQSKEAGGHGPVTFGAPALAEPDQAATVLSRMPLELLTQLRDVALARSRDRPSAAASTKPAKDKKASRVLKPAPDAEEPDEVAAKDVDDPSAGAAPDVAAPDETPSDT